LAANFEKRVAHYTERVARKLESVLPASTEAPRRLHDAMRYAVFAGGKRIRPLLVYASGESLGLDESMLDAPAAAIELIHTFSLVHDDLPAMDDDELRRGKPTLHRQYDEATAILAADAMQPLAFGVLADAEEIPRDARLRLIRLVSDACGSVGMTGGQSLDLAAEGRSLTADEVESMYAMKTGALIHAAIVSPSLLVESLPPARATALDAFARNIGIAFQIRDDILDIEGATQVIGKRAGADVAHNKATWPGLFGVDAARHRSGALVGGALERLDDFGTDADPLRWMAHFITERSH
jgi:geranylgeranyl pyrophosphate synthase